MSSSSLSNLSVKPVGSANSGLLMPKLQFRFRVSFANFGTGTNGLALTKQVIDCQRPNLAFDEITIPIYNSTVYLAGKYKWNPLTINVRDDASGNISSAIGQQLSKQLNFEQMSSARSGSDYKFTTTIEILDGGNGVEPGVLETWELYGCWLTSANYNTLNYATNEAVTIGLTLRYDNANQKEVGTDTLGGLAGTLLTALTGGNA